MTQQKVVKNKAGVNKELKLSNGWDINKKNKEYMLSNVGVFIHGDQLSIISGNLLNVWLYILQDGVYIASIWIDLPQEIKEIKKFIKVA